MKEIIVNSPKYGEKRIQVDDEDYDWLSQYNWMVNKEANGKFYVKRYYAMENGVKTMLRMHREIMKPDNPKILIDHKDQNTLNNQRSNLREADYFQNRVNCKDKTRGTSKHKGVCWAAKRRRWKCSIVIKGKCILVGYFKVENDAAKAYNEAAIKYHGEFAKLNII